jgi:two-component system, NtrC family, sensor histidine kinase HydH
MLRTVLVPGQTYLRSLKTYVDFTDESSALLRQARPIVAPHVSRIIDDFYATIEAHPGARQAITGGKAQIERLKRTLERWLDEMLLGPHDEDYLARRARIGRIHVRISLPQAYMFTAMNRMRVRVAAVIRAALVEDPALMERTLVALHQIMDIELAIMLETYRQDLEAKNRTAERLATIGQFAAGIGHELRNPLSVVETSVFLLRQHFQQQPGEPDPKVKRHLDKIAMEVKRSTATIDDLLELARNRPPRRRSTSLRALLEGAVAAAHLPATIEVEIAAAPSDASLMDPDQISRVLTNLLLNASQAMDGKGRIWMEASRVNGEAKIRVRDSGPGIPVEIRPRIFEALFTTKAKGTGLGLALCRRIVESHGGNVELEPSEGGATFLVTVPEGDPTEEAA